MEGIRKIMIHLWFDTEAEEASEFYHKTFENSRILSKRVIPGTPSGDVQSFTMEIEDISLMLLSAGPYFKLNPSVSFMISCTDKDEVRKYWNAFMEGGKALMPLDTYDFSELYGWAEDRFGVSWQVMHVKEAQMDIRIRPALMFTGKNCGHAEEAIGYYTGIFKNSEIKSVSRYGDNFKPNEPEMLNFAEFNNSNLTGKVLEQAFVRYSHNKHLKIQLGQFRPYFGIEDKIPSEFIKSVDFSNGYYLLGKNGWQSFQYWRVYYQ